MSAGDGDDIDNGTTKGSDGDDENRFSFQIDKIYKLLEGDGRNFYDPELRQAARRIPIPVELVSIK